VQHGRSADVPAGTVMKVSPTGTQAYGATITLTVSDGVPQVQVPDVTGMSKDDAVAALQKVGLKADTQTFISGSKVFNQSPKKGETVDQGSTVKILISFGG